jgi:16S rRNA (adenine1518-N6/adenine1519-N6)-dimethyltransferase
MIHRPRKRFGQNFLQDQSIIDAILRAIHPQATDNCLEIGPGLGAITKPLLKKLSKLTAIEIDTDLQAYLSAMPEGAGRLTLIGADALTVDYNAFGENLRVVGNLPYNISTPLVLRLLHFVETIQDMHFMLQKEVVHRLAAKPGTKAYGRLSVMAQYYCDVECLFDVPPYAFHPQPKVDSAIVRLTPFREKRYPTVSFEALEYLVAHSFGMRRKTLANNLKSLIAVSKIQSLDIDPQLRPEQISVAEYVRLAQITSSSV